MLRDLPVIGVTGRATKVRVLDAVRAYFHRHGESATHEELGHMAGVAAQRIHKYLVALKREGHLTFEARRKRSIMLLDRGDMLSNDELRAACVRRGIPVGAVPMLPLAAAYSVPEGVADRDMKLLGILDDMDNARGASSAASEAVHAGGGVASDSKPDHRPCGTSSPGSTRTRAA